MMKSTRSTAVRQVSSGLYRVSGKSSRSVMTGRFVPKTTTSSGTSTKASGQQNTSRSSTAK